MIQDPPILSTTDDFQNLVIMSFTSILFTINLIKIEILLKQQNFAKKIYLLIKKLKVKESMST